MQHYGDRRRRLQQGPARKSRESSLKNQNYWHKLLAHLLPTCWRRAKKVPKSKKTSRTNNRTCAEETKIKSGDGTKSMIQCKGIMKKREPRELLRHFFEWGPATNARSAVCLYRDIIEVFLEHNYENRTLKTRPLYQQTSPQTRGLPLSIQERHWWKEAKLDSLSPQNLVPQVN